MLTKAYAAQVAGGEIALDEVQLPDLKNDEVLIKVHHCGLCHSDLSMINNDWGMSVYPLIAGHEIVGEVVKAGDSVRTRNIGDIVGVGWFSGSCMTCHQCLSGQQTLCDHAAGAIVGRSGGFAEYVVAQAAWAVPIPSALDASKVGPLFCGGATVFTPFLQNNIRPTQRVGVVGIGGLGHMALQFANKWGCEVVAFTSSEDKKIEALTLGAHQTVDSRNPNEMAALKGSLDMILVTVNVSLDWGAYIELLNKQGVLHFVGAAPSVETPAFALIGGNKKIAGSAVGTPSVMADMVEFSRRHDILPMTEHYKMGQLNDVLERMRNNQVRYRAVLQADF